MKINHLISNQIERPLQTIINTVLAEKKTNENTNELHDNMLYVANMVQHRALDLRDI